METFVEYRWLHVSGQKDIPTSAGNLAYRSWLWPLCPVVAHDNCLKKMELEQAVFPSFCPENF
jgi:hypothetical protein